MKKGFTLIEFVVVMALVAIIMTTASLSIRRVKERRELETAKSEIAAMMQIYVDRAYHEGEAYKLQINEAQKSIKALNNSDELTKLTNLPTGLTYSVSGDGVTLVGGEAEVTTVVDDGDRRAYIDILDYSGNDIYRVEMNKNGVSDLVNISIYKRAGEAWERE